MKIVLRFALPVLLLASLAPAGVIYDRSLDPAHLVTWTPQGNYIIGDDMGFGGFSAGGTINSITVWMVAENTGTTNPNQEAQSITLFLGVDPTVSFQTSNYSFVPAGLFANPNLGRNQPIFAITFSGLNYNFPANAPIDFAIQGVTTGIPFNLASVTPVPPGACPGGPINNDPAPTSCDGVYVAYGTVPNFPAGPYDVVFAQDGGDINILVDGTLVPEPSTFALLGLGTGALLYFRRRRA